VIGKFLVTLKKHWNMENKGKKNNQEELKKKLHELIDSIDDEHTLNVLNEDIVPYVIENRTKEADDIEDNLTAEQLKDLDEAIAEADRGETISFDEFKKNMEEWRTRLRSTGGLK
jgi:PHD/YefM family antitoxin component YafN of YafNO toxin-antitoxin module